MSKSEKKHSEKSLEALPLREAGGFVLYKREGDALSFLLLRSARWDEWGLAKGHRDPEDEDILACAQRELGEETGLGDVLIHSGFRCVLEYQPEGIIPAYLKRVTYFLARLEQGSVRLSDEHSGLEWMPLDQALEALKHENLRYVMSQAEKYLTAPKS